MSSRQCLHSRSDQDQGQRCRTLCFFLPPKMKFQSDRGYFFFYFSCHSFTLEVSRKVEGSSCSSPHFHSGKIRIYQKLHQDVELTGRSGAQVLDMVLNVGAEDLSRWREMHRAMLKINRGSIKSPFFPRGDSARTLSSSLANPWFPHCSS